MTTKINGTVLIAEIAERTGNSRKHVKQILDAMAELTAAHVGSGKAVIIPGRLNRAAAAFYPLAPRRLMVALLARNHPGLN